MVATKRVPLSEVDNGKERKAAGGAIEAGGGGSVDPLGGFIFVCNNDTMGEDFERHLFGLPQRYQDSVKAIQPGLPLFLYNYSTRCLHGVFEASSDGGLNIEPDAWGENKESRKNGRQSISRFPAQVRVRWREERPPLDEEKFRPVLYHYDGPKFRLQLSKSEAQELLKLFGASPVRKSEEVLEDTGGEWEKVKTKSKGGRSFRGAAVAKGPTSPNSSGGRKRGTAQNSSGTNAGASLSGFNNFIHEAVVRGRERDSKIDSAQRWRTDSDSWSGSSSAGTTSCTVLDDERSKKFLHENGFVAEINEGGVFGGGPGLDGINGTASSKGFIHSNGSSVETDQKVEIRLMDDDSSELNGFSISPVGVANSNSRSGFVSYSAALKSGMLGSAAAENGFGENLVSAPTELAVPPTSNSSNRSTISYSSAASATNLSPSSLNRITKGDLSVDTEDSQNQKGVLNKARPHCEGLAGNHGKVGPVSVVENGKQEVKTDSLTNGDGHGKRSERAQPWGKASTIRASLPEFGSVQSAAVGDEQNASVKSAGDFSIPPKKLVKDVLKNVLGDGENGDIGIGNARHGQSDAKESTAKPAEPVVRKNAWQGKDGAVLRLLHDPDPAVNSSSVNGGTNAQGAESEVPKKQETEQTPPLESQEIVVPSLAEKGDSDGHPSLTQFPKQFPNSSSAFLSHGSHNKTTLPQEGPVFQPGRTAHESRRQQFDNQKHEKYQEDRPHFRKQQGHPHDHLQHPSSGLHSQTHQLGQGLMPLHTQTPSPPGLQQHHHHPLLSPSPQPLYRDRSRSRPGNGNAENVHNLTYRPISRNIHDGDVPLQSPLVPGSWGLQSPVLLMQPVISPVTGSFTFPAPSPRMLVNAEALHAEILDFAKAASPSADTRLHAEAAVECVRGSVKQLWPDADVEVFGSFATGLCLHHSDVDVVVVDAPPPEDAQGMFGARLLTPLIRALASALKENEWCEGLNTIETASMPVIKLRCSPIAEGRPASAPVAIDITIGGRRSESFAGISQISVQKGRGLNKPVNRMFEAARNAHNGAAAREFVIERLRQLPALAPLVLLLKQFLRCRRLNDVYSGGLGSFALTLMLVFYLERAPISCGIPQEIPRSSKSPSPVNAGTPSQANGETSPTDGENSSPGSTEILPANGEILSTVNEETTPASGAAPSANAETPSEVSRKTPSPVNVETPYQGSTETSSPLNGETPYQVNVKIHPEETEEAPCRVNGEAPLRANGETFREATGEAPSPVNGATPRVSVEILSPGKRKTPFPAEAETQALSVDTPQAAPASAESADFSDDDSTDSSVLTTTSASSMASMEAAILRSSPHGRDIAHASIRSSDEEPLLRKAGGIVEELLASMQSVGSPNLGTLLIGFLHFFGQEIDFSRVRLVLKGKNGNPGGLFWHEKNARTLPLWIDDPLRPDANIGAGSFNIWQVQTAMRDMLSVICDMLPDGEKVGKGPGRRRQAPLLQQFLVNDSIQP